MRNYADIEKKMALNGGPNALDSEGYTTEERADFDSMGVDPSTGSETVDTQPMFQNVSTAAEKAQKGTNTADQLGTMGMASGNPYAMAAGAALKVVGQAQAKKEQREQQKVNNEIARRNRVMQAMGQLGQGFGSIG